MSPVAVLLCKRAVTRMPAPKARTRLRSARPRNRRRLEPKARTIPLWTICRPHNKSATPPVRSRRIELPNAWHSPVADPSYELAAVCAVTRSSRCDQVEPVALLQFHADQLEQLRRHRGLRCFKVEAALRFSQQAEALLARRQCITRNFRRISGLRSRISQRSSCRPRGIQGDVTASACD